MRPCWHACMGLETLGCGCVNQDICAGKSALLLIVHERSRGTMSEARRYLCQSAQTGCRAHQLPGRLKCHTRFRSRRRAEHVAAMCRRCTCSWFGAPGIQGAWSASIQSITPHLNQSQLAPNCWIQTLARAPATAGLCSAAWQQVGKRNEHWRYCLPADLSTPACRVVRAHIA